MTLMETKATCHDQQTQLLLEKTKREKDVHIEHEMTSFLVHRQHNIETYTDHSTSFQRFAAFKTYNPIRNYLPTPCPLDTSVEPSIPPPAANVLMLCAWQYSDVTSARYAVS